MVIKISFLSLMLPFTGRNVGSGQVGSKIFNNWAGRVLILLGRVWSGQQNVTHVQLCSSHWCLSFHTVHSSTASAHSEDQPSLVYAKYDDGFVVRQMKRSDLPTIVELHAKEGVVSCDFDVVFDSMDDKRFFIVGEYEGQPVAFHLIYKWTSDTQPTIYYGSGFVVDDKFRNRRFGERIFEVSISICTISL